MTSTPNSTLEDLKTRLAIAHKALADATQQLQIAQQAHQKAMSDYNIFSAAVGILSREEEEKKAAAQEKQIPIALTVSVSDSASPTDAVTTQISETAPNKTELVRELLRQHIGGMTPSEIWKELKGQFVHRPYLYSVLKRLRDREEVTFRRNKYALKVKPEEVNSIPNHVVQ